MSLVVEVIIIPPPRPSWWTPPPLPVDRLKSELDGSYGVLVTAALVFRQVLATSFLALSFRRMWKMKINTPVRTNQDKKKLKYNIWRNNSLINPLETNQSPWNELSSAKMIASASPPFQKYVNPKIQVNPRMQNREKEPEIKM